jgi:hypothetical protein
MKNSTIALAIAALLGASGIAAAAVAADSSGVIVKPDPARFDVLDTLPSDQGWPALSASQKDAVRGIYESLGDGDEPPYPAKGVGAILKPLHDAARQIRLDGWIDAIVEVDASGHAKSVSVFHSPEPKLITPLVTGLLMREAYKPGLCKGQPCTMPFALRVNLAH